EADGRMAGAAFTNPGAAVTFPSNFPAEFFYSRATDRIQGIGGGTGRADLGIALEGSFAGGVPLAGDQILFARFRLRVTGGLVPRATYTLTYPDGTKTFLATLTGTTTSTDDQG